MNILIAVASRHGSTREIASTIAQELRSSGHIVAVHDAEANLVTELYDAVIVGSAVYMGNCLPELRRFVELNRARLATMPVWLFSSGPLGEEKPRPHGDPAYLAELLAATKARGHRIFVGRLDPRRLGMGERLIARVVGAPTGDFRDWEAIRAWAREIAAALPVATASIVHGGERQ